MDAQERELGTSARFSNELDPSKNLHGTPARSTGRQTKLTDFNYAYTPNIKALANTSLGSPKPTRKSLGSLDKNGKGGNSAKKARLEKQGSATKSKKSYQSVIDANQRIIGPVQCKVCKCTVDYDDEKDRKIHEVNHALFLQESHGRKGVSYVRQKNELILWPSDQKTKFSTQRIIGVTVHHKQSAPLLVEEVRKALRIIQQEIGSLHILNLELQSELVLMYIDDEAQSIVGLLTAKLVKLPRDSNGLSYCSSSTKNHESLSLLEYCGVNLIWIAQRYRKQGKAKVMLDCLRDQYNRICFNHGLKIDKENLAFSDPTSDGMGFINAYMNGTNYKTYRISLPTGGD